MRLPKPFHRPGRALARLLVALTLVLTMAVSLAPAASAVHSLGLFELDGNAVDDTPMVLPDDSQNVFLKSINSTESPGPDHAFTSTFIAATAEGPAADQTYFKGGGAKDDLDISPAGATSNYWRYDPAAGAPDKDQILDSFAAAYTNPTNGHLVVYFGGDRYDNSGAAELGFWFLQNPVGLTTTKDAGAFDFSGTHQAPDATHPHGDVLVLTNFTQGGGVSSIYVYEWVGPNGPGGTDGSNKSLKLLYSAATETQAECQTGVEQTVCARANAGGEPAPWPFAPKGATPNVFPTSTYFEGGIDLTALGLQGCYSDYLMETRTAPQITGASLKDFALGRFDLCKVNISIAPDAVNEVGQTHTFTVTVSATMAGVPLPSMVGAKPVVTLTASNGAAVTDTVDTCADPGTNSSGQCTVTFTSDTPGKVTGHASVSLQIPGDGVKTAETDGVGDNSGDAVKYFADASITIGAGDTNSVGESHTFTVVVKQNDGTTADYVNAPDGTKPEVTLTAAGGATVEDKVDSCATQGTVNGQCTVTFTSSTAGTVTGHAEVTLTMQPKSGLSITVTRETDGSGGNSGDAVKVFVAGSLTWHKVDNAGQPLSGATFEVCRTKDLNSETGLFEPITAVCASVVDNAAPDEDAAGGEFKLSGLRLGEYTVHETAAPAGYALDPDTITVQLSLTAPDAEITTAFVNERPIVKITGFGYTNTATGTPTAGVVSGTAVYTVTLHNYGDATADLSNSSLTVTTDASVGTLTCAPTSPLALSGTLAAGADKTFTMTCTYSSLNDGAKVTADLVVKYTVNSLEREASGSPASITFTIQAD